jgi:UMF1 family MFS transporter
VTEASPPAEDADGVGDYGSTRERVAWMFFDFANSAFPTIALTAFGGPYFTGVLAGEEVDFGFASLGPAAAWGAAISIAMGLVTLSSPLMGALADRSGKKRVLLAVYVAICVAATAALGLVPPGHGVAAFLLYIIAIFSFEGGYVFYNAFLPELAPPDRIGRLSGNGWALGYIGGLLALVLCYGLVPDEYVPEHAGAASNIFFIVAAWYGVFSIPALAFLRDREPQGHADEVGYFRSAARELARTVKTIRTYKMVLIFLAAYFLYNDAITTVIEFVGIYTKEVLAFTPAENAMIFLVLNLVAAPGAVGFGYVLDRIGGRRAISMTLVLWTLVVILAAVTSTKTAFWGVAALAAVVIGATQASSRALMARLAPKKRVGEFMGFLALSGKASAVLGPTIYGFVATIAAEDYGTEMGHRIAITVIGSFFVLAFLVLSRVDEEAGRRQADEEDAAIEARERREAEGASAGEG